MSTARRVQMASPVRREGPVSWYATEAEAADSVLLLVGSGITPQARRVFGRDGEGGPGFAVTIAPMPVDLRGIPYAVDGCGLPFYPTPCCGSYATIVEGAMCCKGCYRDVDEIYGAVPQLSGEK